MGINSGFKGLKRTYYIALSGELALEEAIDLSQNRLRDG